VAAVIRRSQIHRGMHWSDVSFIPSIQMLTLLDGSTDPAVRANLLRSSGCNRPADQPERRTETSPSQESQSRTAANESGQASIWRIRNTQLMLITWYLQDTVYNNRPRIDAVANGHNR